MRDLSVVIPAFNEAHRIPTTLDSVARYLREADLDSEVIVVDDGSTDATIEVVRDHATDFARLTVVPCGFNGGKGRAVRMGMLTGTGRHRLFLDADNSTDIGELDRLLAAARAEPVEPAVVIGSIAAADGLVTRHQSAFRRRLGRMGNRVIQRLVLPGIDDSQRGFKVFTGEAADRIFPRCRVDGWAFDVEALALARALGYHVLEVPVAWSHCDDSRVRPSAYIETLADVARIAFQLRADAYRLEEPVPTPARDLPTPLELH
ncbi:MAG: glycosyltransferase family 2 protein [Actinobacteria bacterium]|nr:glycosyltransferase family 2 protein [Actinomycetota bacterium]NIS34668.1 glycosyltransferase family 2 protein [Actinomycetota bacterium]NIT97663.1 glycosyltransferase family 2 protein [Actinomycetota bacterium]NIU21313.1 glycosyltransferase family 2 protein [Actinomycetota bacterium]NIU69428.1 glycosyltransferase family 2 protein [Actinomycetota bacterium]